MLASLRYLDAFVKMDGAWLFEERRLYVDWLESFSEFVQGARTVITATEDFEPGIHDDLQN